MNSSFSLFAAQTLGLSAAAAVAQSEENLLFFARIKLPELLCHVVCAKASAE